MMNLNRLTTDINRIQRMRLNENFDIIESTLNAAASNAESAKNSTEGLQQQLDNLVINSGESIPEVIQSRTSTADGRSYPNLRSRLDSEQNKNNQSLNNLQNNKADRSELQEQVSVINSSLQQKANLSDLNNLSSAQPLFVDSVSQFTDTTRNYVLTTNAHIYYYNQNSSSFVDSGLLYQSQGLNPRSVLGVNLDLPYYSNLPISQVFYVGEIQGTSQPNPGAINPGTGNRAYADLLVAIDNAVIIFDNSLVDISYAQYDANGALIRIITWNTTGRLEIPNGTIFRTYFRYKDQRNINVEGTQIISKYVRIETDATYTPKNEVENLVNQTVSPIENNLRNEINELYKPLSFSFTIGGLDATGGLFPSNNRIRTDDIQSFEAGSTVGLSDYSDKSYAIFYFDENNVFIRNTQFIKTDTTFTTQSNFRLMVRYDDNRSVNTQELLQELSSFAYYMTPNQLITKKTADETYALKSEVVNDFTVYVTLSGKDNNDGLTQNTAFATFQRAVNSGASLILAERGTYYNQAINATVKEITIRPISFGNFDAQNNFRQKPIELIGGTLIDNSLWEEFSGIYRQTYSGNAAYNNVFVTQSVAPVSNATRRQYNANLWEGDNTIDDYNLLPVLSLSACQSTVGSFFYDGTYLYVNPKNSISNKFHAVIHNVGLRFPNSQKVTLEEIRARFYRDEPFNLDRINYVDVKYCEAGNGSRSDGFSIDYTNGVFEQCKAYKNRNDGFNLHFQGKTKFINCEGFNNYDDGISHHEGCDGEIIGGRWHGNETGAGIAPAEGAKVSWYNCYLANNRWGVYHAHLASNDNPVGLSFNNLYINNRENQIYVRNSVVESVNDVFVGGEGIDGTTVNIYKNN